MYLVDPSIERQIGDVGRQGFEESDRARLLLAIRDEVGGRAPAAAAPVILTTFTVRRTLRTIIEDEFPHLAVVSYQELSPDLNIQPIARISW